MSHLNLQIDAYKHQLLPENYEIIEVLGDIIMGEYIDVAEDGKSLMRNGIILPIETVDNRAWRMVKALLVGPEVKQVKVGDTIIIAGDKGLQSISRNGKMTVFFNQDRTFGICKPIEYAIINSTPDIIDVPVIPIKKSAPKKKVVKAAKVIKSY